ncbi:MAG: ZrgA family zinc uptake protein [Methylotenera sp.]|jgi:hypothetical protein
MKKLFALLAFFISFTFLSQTLATPLEAHVHGTATLQVAVDHSTLTIHFSSPLDNLLGFEHKPRNQEELKQVQHMIKQFYKPNLFLPTKDAQCKLQSVNLDSIVIKKKKQAAITSQHSHHDESGHADLDAELVYQCNRVKHLHDLQVNVFTVFPNLHKLSVEIVSDRGQTAAKITPSKTQVTW